MGLGALCINDTLVSIKLCQHRPNTFRLPIWEMNKFDRSKKIVVKFIYTSDDSGNIQELDSKMEDKVSNKIKMAVAYSIY